MEIKFTGRNTQAINDLLRPVGASFTSYKDQFTGKAIAHLLKSRPRWDIEFVDEGDLIGIKGEKITVIKKKGAKR